ncbi:MAG: DUF3135 domain-containing protein [Chromatiales bacterium]|nr:DUF3135 domain-containing protein [Chromatiales bacterium]
MRENQANELPEMDFEQWSELAKNDMEAFEKMRLAAIESVIQSAPPHQQRRLRGLQWQIDQERRRASNPLAASIRLSNMMWEALVGPGGLLESLRGVVEPEMKPAKERCSAAVLPFNRPTE